MQYFRGLRCSWCCYSKIYYSAVCEVGDVRLQGGIDSSNGRVEVCQFRTWGAVCSDGWDDNDARVVCRQLGYDPQGLYGLICESTSYCKRLLACSRCNIM